MFRSSLGTSSNNSRVLKLVELPVTVTAVNVSNASGAVWMDLACYYFGHWPRDWVAAVSWEYLEMLVKRGQGRLQQRSVKCPGATSTSEVST